MNSTAKFLLLAAVGFAAASGTHAEPRYNPRIMQCAAVQQAIRDHGAVTLRYMSTRVQNLPLYNRYVRNSGYCDSSEFATPSNVPTVDNPTCRVNICQHRTRNDERNWLLFPFELR